MSYATVKRELANQREPVHVNVSGCAAHGCPCRGTISSEGGRFCCAAHAASVSDRWPAITSALHEAKWLIEFIDEIKAMDRRLEDWRGFAVQFWTNQDDECAPHKLENFTPYENRMRGELLYRCGLAKRASVRLPAILTKRFGNVGQLAGAR